jgi:hypothetical protein
MPKEATKKTSKKADTKHVEAYTHDDVKRKNNPSAGMANHDKSPETRRTYAFDPHLDVILPKARKTARQSDCNRFTADFYTPESVLSFDGIFYAFCTRSELFHYCRTFQTAPLPRRVQLGIPHAEQSLQSPLSTAT